MLKRVSAYYYQVRVVNSRCLYEVAVVVGLIDRVYLPIHQFNSRRLHATHVKVGAIVYAYLPRSPNQHTFCKKNDQG